MEKAPTVYSPPLPATTQQFDIEGFRPITRAATDSITVHSNPASALATMTSGGRSAHVNTSSVLGSLLSVAGRQAFTLTLEDGQLSKLERSDAPSTTPAALNEFMTMQEIARAIRHSYSWVSRNWKSTMRLTPRHIGKLMFFKRSEVESYIERSVVRRKPTGRPKKIIGIVNGRI